MINFTEEHIRVIEKNKSYYDGLMRSGTISKISSVTVDEFKLIYREAISERKFNVWCSSCVVELIELIYSNYNNFLNERSKEGNANGGQTGEQPGLPEPKSKRKGNGKPRRNAAENRSLFPGIKG